MTRYDNCLYFMLITQQCIFFRSDHANVENLMDFISPVGETLKLIITSLFKRLAFFLTVTRLNK
jgi:hypothetical protein